MCRKISQLTTQRLILRQKRRGDAAGVLNYYTDPKVRCWLGGFPPDSLRQVRKMLGNNDSPASFVIIEKSSGRVIGEIDIYNIVQRTTAAMGYILLSEYWGMGYMSEAVAAVLKVAFRDMGLERIRVQIITANQRSRRLVERFGFEYEAEFKQADFGGRIADVCYYSLSRKNYLSAGL